MSPPPMRFPNAHALPSMFPPVLPEMTRERLTAAANAYRQPAPPPQLPLLQLQGRHQDPYPPPERSGDGASSGGGGDAVAGPSCPHRNRWPQRGEHANEGQRTAKLSDEEVEELCGDMAVLVRREFDCWVESCWTEAFHHVFTRTIPTFIITLILAGASSPFMRKQIVHGGPALDQIFMTDMLQNLYTELERRLSGRLVPAEVAIRGESSAMATAAAAIGAGGLGAQPSTPGLPRDGVCTNDLGPSHGANDEDDDDHAACLCQLTCCPDCLHEAVVVRKKPVGLLPFELATRQVSKGWPGEVETEAQARTRWKFPKLRSAKQLEVVLPPGAGFARHTAKSGDEFGADARRAIFPHPQMTDVLAVEEHLRWRLKELGAVDPSVESRYGPSTNAGAALEGLEHALKLDEDDGSEASAPSAGRNGRKMTVGRSKARFNKAVKAPPKAPKAPAKKVYLPTEWAEGDPAERNTAIVLTFRHFVKLLHRAAANATPFAYAGYSRDVAALETAHPVAVYRRLTEATATRKARPAREARLWGDCMEKWTEELGAREKAAGNVHVNAGELVQAIRCYTRAISLDGKKTVYYSNRAVAFNTLGKHALAESDCKHILAKDAKNSKAFYQRAVARGGMERWREAEADLKHVLRLQPGNEAAQKLMVKVKAEVAKLPKQRLEDVLNF